MSTYYITPTGLSQGDLVNFLKDVETAMGGTNTAGSISTTTTPLASQALSRVTSVVLTPSVAINSVMSAGSIMASGISVAVASGATGGFMSLLSRIDSRLTSHSI